MIQFKSHDDLIYDIGMNHGADAAYYAKKGFRVLSVEANPKSVEIARSRYAALIGSGKISILNKALSETSEGFLDLFVCNEESGKTTTVPDMVKHLEHVGFSFTRVRTPCTHILDVIAEWGVPYYMKIDIEGWDIKLLRQILEHSIKPEYLSVEVSIRQYPEMLNILDKIGYREYQLVSQRSVPDQVEPSEGFEGIAINPEFTLGNSGLFGKDLPDAWVSIADIKKQLGAVSAQDLALRAVMKIHRNLPVDIGLAKLTPKVLPKAYDWFDLHAR